MSLGGLFFAKSTAMFFLRACSSRIVGLTGLLAVSSRSRSTCASICAYSADRSALAAGDGLIDGAAGDGEADGATTLGVADGAGDPHAAAARTTAATSTGDSEHRPTSDRPRVVVGGSERRLRAERAAERRRIRGLCHAPTGRRRY